MKSLKIGYQHDIIQEYKRIKQGSKDKPYTFVVEGSWGYEKIIDTDSIVTHFFYCDSLIKTELHRIITRRMLELCKNCFEISEKTMDRITTKDKKIPFVAICEKQKFNDVLRKVVILDGLENPGNIGTIFRTCDGAGIDAVLIVNQKAKINNYKVIKASMGGCFSVPWYHFDSIPDVIDWLGNEYKILLADPKGVSDFQEVKDFQKSALVIGNERYGLSKDWYEINHTPVTIPMKGCCDSLNAAVAASILIYHIT